MTSLDERADNSAEDGAALPLAAAEGPISDRPDPIARRRLADELVFRCKGPPGLWATPPSANRAAVTRPSSTASTAATDTSAKA